MRLKSVKNMLSGGKSPLMLGVSALYLVALFGVWIICQRDARQKTESVLDYGCRDVAMSIDIMIDGQLAEKAETAAADMGGELKALSVAECQRLVKVHRIDEICLINGKGKIIASSEPAKIGFDVSTCEKTREFMACTNKATPYVSQDFSASWAGPQAAHRKYLGVPFLKGEGFVLVGSDESRQAELFAKRYNIYMGCWQLGETGCFICFDGKTRELLFDAYADENSVHEVRGQHLEDHVLGLKNLTDDKVTTFKATAFGQPCFCRSYRYLGYWILPAVPEADFYSAGHRVTFLAAVVLLLVIVVFCYTINRIRKANEAIARIRMLEDERQRKEMNTAKSIQASVLPCLFPPYPNMADCIDIFARMRAARSVGGDFYDFYFVNPGKLALVIADVSGKGIPAAMFMMRAKTTLQTLLKSGGDIAAIMKEANSRLCQGNEADMFVTAWVGIVDLANGKIEYVNAGHNPPIVRRVDGTFDYLREKHGPPLAAMDGIDYRKGLVDLSLGEGVFLYTDGVTEATNPALELYGEDRLIKNFRAAKSVRTSQELCVDLFADLDKFADVAEQADDITMLAFKMNGIERTFDASQKGLLDAQSLLEEFGNNPKASIILDEITSNIVRCSGARSFTVKLLLVDNDLTMVFKDDGTPFDLLTDTTDPDVKASAEMRSVGGLGVYMVKKMAKAIGYARTDGQNILTVTVTIT